MVDFRRVLLEAGTYAYESMPIPLRELHVRQREEVVVTDRTPEVTNDRYTAISHSAADDWLIQRGTGIGASEIAAVFGVSPWLSAFELWQHKIYPEDTEQITNDNFEWSKKLERVMLDDIAERAGVQLKREPQSLYRSIAHPWAVATPDDMTFDNEPVEVKNACAFMEREWEERVPEHYYLQCQHQMLVTGAERCLFGAQIGGQRPVWEWILRSPDTITRIVRAGAEFWNMVVSKTPPIPDGSESSRRALKAIRNPRGPAVELFNCDDLFADWQSAKVAEKDAKRALGQRELHRKSIENQLALSLGKSQFGATASGWGIQWVETSRKGYTVDPTTVTTLKISTPRE